MSGGNRVSVIEKLTTMLEGVVAGKGYQSPDFTAEELEKYQDHIPRIKKALATIEDGVANREDKDTERVLSELSAQKRAIDAHSIVSISNVKGDIIYANDKFCEISGYTREELLGQNHRIVKSDEHAPEMYNMLWRTIANGRIWQGDIKNKKKNGSHYWVNTTIVPFLDDQGKPFQYISIRTDITAERNRSALLRKVTKEAEAAALAKSQFLAAMSHEIRTPMAAIVGMSQLLSDSKLSPKQKDWANSIKVSGENLLQILNEILDQSKLEAGKLAIDPTEFDLKQFTESTIQLFYPKIEEKGLSLKINFQEGYPEVVYADRIRIGQVLSNLLSNALKFTNTGGIEVAVTYVYLPDNKLKLSFTVLDTGIGISEDAIENLFQPFSQADNSTSRTYGGTGLGLSISKQLVELMGGHVHVESRPNLGSEFRFSIFCEAGYSNIDDIQQLDKTGVWTSNEKIKILVAEDNAINQELITSILDNVGHDYEVVENGQYAYVKANDEKFDIILMDIRMPLIDGIEAAKLIRSSHGLNQSTPIIAFTADVTSGNIKEYLTAGMNDVCTKPIEVEKLFSSMNKLLGREIHSFEEIPYADDKEEDTQRDVPSDFIENHTSFKSFLSGINELSKSGIAVSESQRNPLLQLGGNAAKEFLALLSKFEDSLSQNCAEMMDEVGQIDLDVPDQTKVRKIWETLHVLKGNGASFDYPLVTEIILHLESIVDKNSDLEADDIKHLSNHLEVLKAVSDNKIICDGGNVGTFLMSGLKHFTDN